MRFTRSSKTLGAVLAAGLITGGVVAAVSPATASDAASAVTTNWKKVWKQKLRPQADKRYYTKSQSDARYTTPAQNDARHYSKAESDSKYATKTPVYRGTYATVDHATATGQAQVVTIPFPVTLSARPTHHFIKAGDPVPAGCSGTVQAPDASPGHLCIFEYTAGGLQASRDVNTADASPGVSPFGAIVWVYSSGAVQAYTYGSWAVAPLAP